MCVCYERMIYLMKDFSASKRTIYVVTVSKNMDCSCGFISVLTSGKLAILFSKSKLLIKTLFQIMS